MSASIQCFIQPSYGAKTALVNWTIPAGWEEASWFIYRSRNGVSGWVCLNEAAPVRDASVWADIDFTPPGKIATWFYRVVGELEDEEQGGILRVKSPAAGVYERLSPRDYRYVYAMMVAEVETMRRTGGLKMLHCIPKTSGELNPAFDIETGQLMAGCDDSGYGLRYVGGFDTPKQTWIKLHSRGPEVKKDNPDGTGAEEMVVAQARMLAYPQPRRGHMLVHPPTDDRYVVGDTVVPFRYLGMVPIAYTVPLILLHRSDPRYRFPVEPLSPDPV